MNDDTERETGDKPNRRRAARACVMEGARLAHRERQIWAAGRRPSEPIWQFESIPA
jgi:hypothetical protein